MFADEAENGPFKVALWLAVLCSQLCNQLRSMRILLCSQLCGRRFCQKIADVTYRARSCAASCVCISLPCTDGWTSSSLDRLANPSCIQRRISHAALSENPALTLRRRWASSDRIQVYFVYGSTTTPKVSKRLVRKKCQTNQTFKKHTSKNLLEWHQFWNEHSPTACNGIKQHSTRSNVKHHQLSTERWLDLTSS